MILCLSYNLTGNQTRNLPVEHNFNFSVIVIHLHDSGDHHNNDDDDDESSIIVIFFFLLLLLLRCKNLAADTASFFQPITLKCSTTFCLFTVCVPFLYIVEGIKNTLLQDLMEPVGISCFIPRRVVRMGKPLLLLLTGTNSHRISRHSFSLSGYPQWSSYMFLQIADWIKCVRACCEGGVQ